MGCEVWGLGRDPIESAESGYSFFFFPDRSPLYIAGIDSVNEPCGAFFRLTPSSHVQSAESSMQPAAFAIAIALK